MIWPKITTYHAAHVVFWGVPTSCSTKIQNHCRLQLWDPDLCRIAVHENKSGIWKSGLVLRLRACSVVSGIPLMKQTPVDDFKQIKQLLNNGAKCKYISYVKQLSWNRCLGMLEKKQYKSSTKVCSILNPNKKTIHIVGLCFI